MACILPWRFLVINDHYDEIIFLTQAEIALITALDSMVRYRMYVMDLRRTGPSTSAARQFSQWHASFSHPRFIGYL